MIERTLYPDPARTSLANRDVKQAMLRGGALKCPACGHGRLYERYLKICERCEACGEELHHHRADDAPPYIVILILGHLLVSGMMTLEFSMHPPLWVHLAIWIPLTILLPLAALPPVKGAVVALQWALRMHGFGSEDEA